MMFFEPVGNIRRGRVGKSSKMAIETMGRIQGIRSQKSPVQKIPHIRDAVVINSSKRNI
jgi:hypothetical protein